MDRKKHAAEEIVTKLRQVDVLATSLRSPSNMAGITASR